MKVERDCLDLRRYFFENERRLQMRVYFWSLQADGRTIKFSKSRLFAVGKRGHLKLSKVTQPKNERPKMLKSPGCLMRFRAREDDRFVRIAGSIA